MIVSGFTFIRNGIKFGYPFLEAIQSIIPVCDEVVVVVGNSDDGTRDAIIHLNSPKIKIIDSVWDESKRDGGRILAEQTDIAFSHIIGDWGFYIQGDEVIHEKYLTIVLEAMKNNLGNNQVEGLLFDYFHFYGSYDYVASSRDWYRNEIRIVKNDKSIRSWKDAQGFRKNENGKLRKLNVKAVDACIYHYGWVRPPQVMMEKVKEFHRWWHSDDWIKNEVGTRNEFDYSGIDILSKFSETHPAVMKSILEKMNWDFVPDISKIKHSVKSDLLNLVESKTGWRVGENKNYRLIK